MTHVMTALTMSFRVYSCHFCNKIMLILSFGPAKALNLLTNIILYKG